MESHPCPQAGKIIIASSWANNPRSLIQSHAAVRSSAILPSFPSGRPVIASWFILTNVREPIYSDLFPLLTQHRRSSKDSSLKIIDLLTDWAMAELQS